MQHNDNKENEKRVFPRMDTECPVLYAVGNSKKWQVGILVNMSATGLMMKNLNFSILLKPGQNRLVPEIAAKGKIIRCIQVGDEEYEISCKLTEVKPQKKMTNQE